MNTAVRLKGDKRRWSPCLKHFYEAIMEFIDAETLCGFYPVD
jgi:hypothetical protein